MKRDQKGQGKLEIIALELLPAIQTKCENRLDVSIDEHNIIKCIDSDINVKLVCVTCCTCPSRDNCTYFEQEQIEIALKDSSMELVIFSLVQQATFVNTKSDMSS